MEIQPNSFAFTLLLGFLAAVPYSGIDINLPALAATGASLGRNASDVGLTMSAFMFSLAVAPLVYGPVSDRFGRKPVVAFGVALFVVASVACAFAQSLATLVIYRFIQGIGAASTAMIFAIIRDLFGEATARAKIANVVVAINVVTVIAPTAGAALLTLGSWRLIYAVQAAIGIALWLAVLLGFSESARIDPGNRLKPAAVVQSYLRVLTHRVSFAYILVGAAGGATVFAYVTGASLFFIGVAGLTANQYGLIFSACSAAVMSGAILDGRLGRRGVPPAQVVTIGLALAAAVASMLLAITLDGWTRPALVAVLLIAVALAFGMTAPNVLNATMQPLPDIAGAVGAAAGSIQMIAGAVSSALVAVLFDGRSALSMAAVMATSSLLALILYWVLARPAERRIDFAGDRKKDVVFVKGFNVFPREVEEVIHTHPKVHMVAVVGVPDARTSGDRLIAFVVPRTSEEIDPAELSGFCLARLVGYKCPTEVRLVKQLPVTNAEKLDRIALRRAVSDGAGAT